MDKTSYIPQIHEARPLQISFHIVTQYILDAYKNYLVFKSVYIIIELISKA